jgi:hypothetical protein
VGWGDALEGSFFDEGVDVAHGAGLGLEAEVAGDGAGAGELVVLGVEEAEVVEDGLLGGSEGWLMGSC